MNILIIGSGPNAIEARSWDRSPFDRIVVINNAWRVRDDWDDMIFPYDFADQNKPARIEPHQRFITEADFVPAQNSMGGFVYAGATDYGVHRRLLVPSRVFTPIDRFCRVQYVLS